MPIADSGTKAADCSRRWVMLTTSGYARCQHLAAIRADTAEMRSKASVALVSSRLLVAFDFSVFAWPVIWPAVRRLSELYGFQPGQLLWRRTAARSWSMSPGL